MISLNDQSGGTTAVKDDYQNLVNLLAVLTEANNRIAAIQNQANEEFLECIDEHKPEFAALQSKITEAEGALELIARRHPEWFKDGKTVKCPYGSVSLKNNPPKLEVAHEEWSIDLIEKADEEAKAKYLRPRTELNLEALSELADDELAKFRIKRVQGDRFEAKPAKIDMGKAVKESEASAAAAEKKAKR